MSASDRITTNTRPATLYGWLLSRRDDAPLNWLSTIIGSDDDRRLHSALAWLWGFVWPHRLAIAGLLGLALVASALALVQPWLTKLLIDHGLLARDYRTLVVIAVVMLGVGLLGTLLGGLNRYLHTRLSGRILFALREDLYAHLQRLSPTFYGRRRTGDILSRLDGDVAEIQRFAIDSLFSSVSNVLGLVGAIALMLALSWQLALLVAVLIPLEIVYLRSMRRRVERHTRRVRERSADIGSFLVETLPAMKFIQGVGAERRESDKLHGLGEHYLSDLLRLQVVQFLTSAVPGVLTSLSRAGAFLIGGYWVIQGTWPLGSLIAFSTYLGMATGPVQGLLGLYVAVQRMVVSLERIAELRREAPSVQPPDRPRALPEPLRGELVLDAVSFRYPDRTAWVLDAASARLPAGCRIGLGGASGVGKTTLIDLVMRHYDPQRGRLLLDGVDLRELDPAALRRRIAVVSQDLVLFRGTVLDNLRYANPKATAAQLDDVVARARLTDLVDSLPQGLETELGERGVQLSGGQKQRVAIARALLQDPAVLILDEATSAVDEATEAQVIAAVDQLFAGRTRILISHRPSTLARTDRCLRLRDGKLCEVSAVAIVDD